MCTKYGIQTNIWTHISNFPSPLPHLGPPAILPVIPTKSASWLLAPSPFLTPGPTPGSRTRGTNLLLHPTNPIHIQSKVTGAGIRRRSLRVDGETYVNTREMREGRRCAEEGSTDPLDFLGGGGFWGGFRRGGAMCNKAVGRLSSGLKGGMR